jgi:hypothetical protein
MMSVFKTIAEVDAGLHGQLENFKKNMALQDCYAEPVNTYHIVLASSGPFDESAMISRIESILKDKKDELKCLGIRMVNFLVPQPPKVSTAKFRASLGFVHAFFFLSDFSHDLHGLRIGD